jgi:hypothetical protein
MDELEFFNMIKKLVTTWQHDKTESDYKPHLDSRFPKSSRRYAVSPVFQKVFYVNVKLILHVANCTS